MAKWSALNVVENILDTYVEHRKGWYGVDVVSHRDSVRRTADLLGHPESFVWDLVRLDAFEAEATGGTSARKAGGS